MGKAGVTPRAATATATSGSAVVRSIADPPARRTAPVARLTRTAPAAAQATGRGVVAVSGGFRGRRRQGRRGRGIPVSGRARVALLRGAAAPAGGFVWPGLSACSGGPAGPLASTGRTGNAPARAAGRPRPLPREPASSVPNRPLTVLLPGDRKRRPTLGRTGLPAGNRGGPRGSQGTLRPRDGVYWSLVVVEVRVRVTAPAKF